MSVKLPLVADTVPESKKKLLTSESEKLIAEYIFVSLDTNSAESPSLAVRT
jgi:hypothetical protein